jgi:hypothetical protein
MWSSVLTVALLLLPFIALFYFFFPLARGAIYVPRTPEKAALMAEMSGAGPGERAADLGSGDGRVVIALARRGAEAHGFEVNPLLVLVSRWKVRRAGLDGAATIHWKSFWRADLSPFDALTLFQGSFVMRRLEAKIRRELRYGSRVVSDYWAFPTLAPEHRSGTVYRYRIQGVR